MKKVNSLIYIYDIWCLAVLSLLPIIFSKPLIPFQLINYGLISFISFFWLRTFWRKNKNHNSFFKMSFYLRNLTVFFPLLLLLISILRELE